MAVAVRGAAARNGRAPPGTEAAGWLWISSRDASAVRSRGAAKRKKKNKKGVKRGEG